MFYSSNNDICAVIIRKALSLFICTAFVLTGVVQPVYAQTVFNLPNPGAMINLSDAFAPVVLKGVSIHPEDPLLFDFIVDNGHTRLQGQALTDETTKLVKYFLAGLAVPENDLWVNLSPVEKDRIMEENLSHTDVGRDMLAQDYILKQITSTLMYPEKDLGRKFWDEVYKRSYEQFGNTDVPVDTFNKVWITPDEATVYQNGNNAFVAGAHLKVMLEADYQAENNMAQTPGEEALGTAVARDVVREVLLPVLEKEVNEGRNFAPLRQVFQSMVLAGWYKNALKTSLLNQVYTNTNKVDGIEIAEKDARQKVYAQYLEAYQKGVYNYIKEEFDQNTKETTPRKYFSGGEVLKPALNPKIKTRKTATFKERDFAEKNNGDTSKRTYRMKATSAIDEGMVKFLKKNGEDWLEKHQGLYNSILSSTNSGKNKSLFDPLMSQVARLQEYTHDDLIKKLISIGFNGGNILSFLNMYEQGMNKITQTDQKVLHAKALQELFTLDGYSYLYKESVVLLQGFFLNKIDDLSGKMNAGYSFRQEYFKALYSRLLSLKKAPVEPGSPGVARMKKEGQGSFRLKRDHTKEFDIPRGARKETVVFFVESEELIIKLAGTVWKIPSTDIKGKGTRLIKLGDLGNFFVRFSNDNNKVSIKAYDKDFPFLKAEEKDVFKGYFQRSKPKTFTLTGPDGKEYREDVWITGGSSQSMNGASLNTSTDGKENFSEGYTKSIFSGIPEGCSIVLTARPDGVSYEVSVPADFVFKITDAAERQSIDAKAVFTPEYLQGIEFQGYTPGSGRVTGEGMDHEYIFNGPDGVQWLLHEKNISGGSADIYTLTRMSDGALALSRTHSPPRRFIVFDNINKKNMLAVIVNEFLEEQAGTLDQGKQIKVISFERTKSERSLGQMHVFKLKIPVLSLDPRKYRFTVKGSSDLDITSMVRQTMKNLYTIPSTEVIFEADSSVFASDKELVLEITVDNSQRHSVKARFTFTDEGDIEIALSKPLLNLNGARMFLKGLTDDDLDITADVLERIRDARKENPRKPVSQILVKAPDGEDLPSLLDATLSLETVGVAEFFQGDDSEQNAAREAVDIFALVGNIGKRTDELMALSPEPQKVTALLRATQHWMMAGDTWETALGKAEQLIILDVPAQRMEQVAQSMINNGVLSMRDTFKMVERMPVPERLSKLSLAVQARSVLKELEFFDGEANVILTALREKFRKYSDEIAFALVLNMAEDIAFSRNNTMMAEVRDLLKATKGAPALVTADIEGGIDLGSGNYLKVIATDEAGMPAFDPAQIQQLEKDLRGIVPVPVGVPVPVNMRPLLGLDPNSGNDDLQVSQLNSIKLEEQEAALV